MTGIGVGQDILDEPKRPPQSFVRDEARGTQQMHRSMFDLLDREAGLFQARTPLARRQRSGADANSGGQRILDILLDVGGSFVGDVSHSGPSYEQF